VPSDRTRSSDDIRQGYRGIAAQQGRVILDRDINALQSMLGTELRRETLDIVGLCGTPDDGFAISLPTLASPVSPPRPVSAAPSRRFLPGSFPPHFVLTSPPPPDPFDFLIRPGTMYLGGVRAVLPQPSAGATPISYDHQPDWLSPSPPMPDPPQIEFIYLDVAEHEVSAVEDDDLRDVALGGPDTTQRILLMQRVKRLGVADGTCSAGLADAVTAWRANGFTLDATTLRLIPQVTLKVGFSDVQVATSPCEPGSTGGYLQADNQLIRVMITGPGTLVWSYDNASFIYRVTAQPDGKTLQLAETPVDAYHRPARNQAVEVLRGAAALPNGGVVAEATGRITKLAAPYDGTSIVLTDPLTTAEAGDLNLFLRIWQDTATFVPSQPVALGATGLTVTLQVPTGAALSVGAYWIIAVRPSTPQRVYPERLLANFEPADGPMRWICPLAVIDWTASPGPNITDCRVTFDNLVDLSRRRAGGCCTITLHPPDLAQSDPITVIDRLIALAGVRASAATICFSPGTYTLVKPLRLGTRHRGLTIEACAGEAIVVAANQTDPDFLDGLIVIDQTDEITIRGLDIAPPAVPFVAAILARKVPNADVVASVIARFGNVAGMVAVRVVQSDQVTIEDCIVGFGSVANTVPFAAGVLVSGACRLLRVTGCTFAGAQRPIFQARPGGIRFVARSLRGALLAPADVNADTTAPTATAIAAAPVTSISGAVSTSGAPSAASAAFLAGTITTVASVSLATDITTATTPRLTLLASAALSRGIIGGQQPANAQFGVVWSTAITVTSQRGDQPEQVVLPARIDDLTMNSCTFLRVAAGVLTIADTGAVRLDANTLSDSIGGFWLDSTGLGATPAVPLLLKNISGMAELVADANGTSLFGLLMALLYPLPSAAKAAGFTASPPPHIMLVNNQLTALPLDGSQSGPGLVILTTFLDALNDVNAVVSVTGNQVSNRSSQSITGAGVFVGPEGGLVIGGNLLANMQPPASPPPGAVSVAPPSLLLLQVASSNIAGAQVATTLAVTGNTLRGSNNLNQNLRPGFNPPLNNWTFANAVVA
jgi:hypothetical protein